MQCTDNRSISNIFQKFLKLLCWFLSTLAKSLKLFLLAHISTFHASPHPRFNDVGMPLMRCVATPLGLPLIIEPGVRGGRREHEKVSNFWPRLKGRLAKSHLPFNIFWRRQKIENLKFWKWIFWISNGRNYRDPEAPLAVVLRGDTTTRGATRARSWRKCYLWTVDRDGRQQSTRPPGVSLLTRKNTAFPNVLLLQEFDEFSTVNSQQQIKINYNFN